MDDQYKSFENIKRDFISALGTPYYETQACILFCGDTLVMQEKLDGAFFHTVITSPPYNIGKEYEEVKTVGHYVEWSVRWISDTSRLLLPNGSFLLNLGYLPVEGHGRAVPIPYLLWDKIPLYLNQEIVWNYSAGVACKKYLSPRNEKIMWYVKDQEHYTFNLDAIRDKNIKYPNSKRNGKSRVNTLGKNPSDVWEIAKVTTGFQRASKERTPHPCQSPMDLIDRLILGFSNPGDILFDPFAGSGTTLVSAIRHGRFCVGFEIRPDYCEIAKRRMESAMFDAVDQIALSDWK